jgi:hypothetical protein
VRSVSRTLRSRAGSAPWRITLSIPGAVELIRRLATRYAPDGVAVGAGTVLDGYAAYECIRAGAAFLVSPQLNPEMIRVANRYQVPTISGACTPTEMLETAEAGADIVKMFPDRERGYPLRQGRARAAGAPADHARRWCDMPRTSRSGSPQAWRASVSAAPSRRRGSLTGTSLG